MCISTGLQPSEARRLTVLEAEAFMAAAAKANGETVEGDESEFGIEGL